MLGLGGTTKIMADLSLGKQPMYMVPKSVRFLKFPFFFQS